MFRWVSAPLVSVRAVALYAPSTPDFALPSKQVVRDAHQAARSNPGALAGPATLFSTVVGTATLHGEGLFRVGVGMNGRDVLFLLFSCD